MTWVPEAETGLEVCLVVNAWAIDMMPEHRAQEEVAGDDMKLVLDVTRISLYGGQNGLLFREAEPGVETSVWGEETPG